MITTHLINQISEAIISTGAFIRNERKTFVRESVEIKGLNDLVSYVDRTAEERLQTIISELLPGSGFINEESGSHNTDSEYVWIIDPLDGTTNFIFNLPLYSISVALQHNGETVLGWVYGIMQDELFFAQKNVGAYLNGTQFHCSRTPHLSESLLATGFPYHKFDVSVRGYLETLLELMHKTRGIRRLGSAALDLAYTAIGRFDAFFESTLMPWDVAAGGLIVQEAGGKVSDYHGSEHFIFGQTIIASNGAIHDELLSIIRKHYS